VVSQGVRAALTVTTANLQANFSMAVASPTWQQETVREEAL
jgi:hypothetical protein